MAAHAHSLVVGPRLEASSSAAAVVAVWVAARKFGQAPRGQLDGRVMVSCKSVEPSSDGQASGCPCCRPEIQRLTRRINAKLSRRGFVAGAGAAIAGLGLPKRARAQTAQPGQEPPIALTNFLLFDGKSGSLRGGLSLLIEGGRIKSIATGSPASPGFCAPSTAAGGWSCRACRRALAFGVRSAAGFQPVRRRCRLYLSRREHRGRAHADARLHHGSRSRRSLIPAQAGDR